MGETGIGRRRGRTPWWAARLTVAWRWVLGIAWGALCAGYGALIDLSDYLGKLPAWWDWRVAVALLPLATILTVAVDRGGALPLSLASSTLVVVLAVVDLAGERTGLAVVEGVLAAAAFLVSGAAFAGRRAEQPPEPLPPPRPEDLVPTSPSQVV